MLAGICRHGRGTLTRPDGSVYHGHFHQHLRHGPGQLSLPNGDRYEGPFVADVPEGSGRAYYAASKGTYTGEFKGGLRCGWGRLELASGVSYEGEWRGDRFHGFGTYRATSSAGTVVFEGEYAAGQRVSGKEVVTEVLHPDATTGVQTRTYEGGWRGGKYHGQGLLVIEGAGVATGWERFRGTFYAGSLHDAQGEAQYGPSSCYRGAFEHGVRSGRGCLFSVSPGFETGHRLVYSGEWAEDKFHGQGTWTLADGKVFKATFQAGVLEGRGLLKHPSGYRFEGAWKGGRKDGLGREILASGEEYCGTFRNDQRHGHGRCSFADGTVFEGPWENGLWVQSEADPRTTKVRVGPHGAGRGAVRAGERVHVEILGHDDRGNRRLSGGDQVRAFLSRLLDSESASYGAESTALELHREADADAGECSTALELAVEDRADGSYIARSDPLERAGSYRIVVTVGARGYLVQDALDVRIDVRPSAPDPRRFVFREEIPRALEVRRPYRACLVPRDRFGNTFRDADLELELEGGVLHGTLVSPTSAVTQLEARVERSGAEDAVVELVLEIQGSSSGLYTLDAFWRAPGTSSVRLPSFPRPLEVIDAGELALESPGPMHDSPAGVRGPKDWDRIALEAYREVQGSLEGFEDVEEENTPAGPREIQASGEDGGAPVPVVERVEDLWKALSLSKARKAAVIEQ